MFQSGYSKATPRWQPVGPEPVSTILLNEYSSLGTGRRATAAAAAPDQFIQELDSSRPVDTVSTGTDQFNQNESHDIGCLAFSAAAKLINHRHDQNGGGY